MKKLYLVLSLLVISVLSYAAVVSHTDYTSGSVISASGQNTNENTIFNEFNGNIDDTNIKTGGVINANIADNTIAIGKLATIVQSTITYTTTFGTYRRPRLVYIDANSVLSENNTATANQTCIQFPDQQRCLTANTGNRTLSLNQSANFTTVDLSGLRSGYTRTANTWYAIYAVKSQDVSTDFVLVADTITASTDPTSLNSAFGVNGWYYLGEVRNGDGSGATTSVVSFIQSGQQFYATNVSTGAAENMPGIRLANTSGATTLTYTYSAGVSGTAIPGHLLVVDYGVASNGATTSFRHQYTDSGATHTYSDVTVSTSGYTTARIKMAASEGIKVTGNGANNMAINIYLVGWEDAVLTSGFNPQL